MKWAILLPILILAAPLFAFTLFAAGAGCVAIWHDLVYLPLRKLFTGRDYDDLDFWFP